MKDTFFFSHDFSARNDPKLQEVLATHGMAGIGLYWCIIEQLYEQGGVLPLKASKTIAFILHCDHALVDSLINDFGLFDNDGEVFWSESAKRRIDKMAETSAKRKVAANERWGKDANAMQMQCKSNAKAMHPKSKCNANKIKENKINNNNSRSLSLSHESEKSEEQKERDERDLFFEIFFYKNFQHPDKEVERFVAHYSAVGWCRSNGQAITDKTAVAQLWEQADKNAPPRFPQQFLDSMKIAQETIRESGEDASIIIKELRRIECTNDYVRLICSKPVVDIIERCAVGPFVNTPFFRGKQLLYAVPRDV